MRCNLRESVSIQSEARTADDRSGASVTWSEVYSLRCSVDEAWARERLASSGLEGNTGVAIMVRYTPGIVQGMIAVIASGAFAGTYNIRGVLIVKARGTSRPEATILDCERGVAT